MAKNIKAAKYVNAGNIVPIKIAIKTIINAIKNAPTPTIIIDGYPRSLEQMSALDEYLKNEKELELVSCIEVVVSEEVAKDRVLRTGGRVAHTQQDRA